MNGKRFSLHQRVPLFVGGVVAVCTLLRECDAGLTMVTIVPNAKVAKASQPQVAVSSEGAVYIAYGHVDATYCSVSRDGGRAYERPAVVGRIPHLALGMRRGPRIAVGPQGVVVSAIGGELGGGKDGDLWAWHSTDGGNTWGAPVRVNDVVGAAREGLHAMAAGPGGQAACVWLDLRHKGTEIALATSTDGGRAWSANGVVYRSPSGSVCECCHPSVSYDERGGLYIMWRNSVDGLRDMYWTFSNDGGQTFTEASKLGQGSWPLDACPMDGGSLAVNAAENPQTVWRRDRQVVVAEGAGRTERLLGEGEQPWIAGSYCVWLRERPGRLMLLHLPENAPATLAEEANHPVLVAPLGQREPVIAAWETAGGGIAACVVSPAAKPQRRAGPAKQSWRYKDPPRLR